MDVKKSQVAQNHDSLPSAQPFASLGFCLDLSYELQIRHQHNQVDEKYGQITHHRNQIITYDKTWKSKEFRPE